MTEQENKLIQIAIDKIDDVNRKLEQIDRKVDVHAERLVIVETQQKFVEGTIKQYKEDIHHLFENNKEKLKDDFTVVHEKIRDQEKMTEEKIKNSNNSIKIWVLIATISGILSVIGLALNILLK